MIRTLCLGVALSLAATCAGAAETPFPVRMLYAPGHFGNSYEVMGDHEFQEMLEEARWWGFNGYADWFDTVDCANPFEGRFCNMGDALWDKKRGFFKIAQDLGLETHLVITPNHVFLDQVGPNTAAETGDRIFGQLVCPSKPEGRAVILENYGHLLSELAEAGVRLNGINAAPYDYGGCACKACQPWILTFAKLVRDIHDIALRHHPGVELHCIGWWWSEEEHRLFADWADREIPGRVKSIALHIPYGETDVSGVPLPEGCERRAFVHIGYADQASPRDIYGHLGPVIAPARLEETVSALKAHGCAGVMAYSEGVYEDANKALLAGMGSGRYADADGVLRAYAQRHFAASPEQAPSVAEWLRQWGAPYSVDADAAELELETLWQPVLDKNWRAAQWAAKTRLMQAYHAIGAEGEWREERLAAVELFWRRQEALHRGIYGLGPLRHILNRRYSPFPWYKGYAEHLRRVAAETPDEG